MRFCELETDLQTKMSDAMYKDSKEIKNVVNRALQSARNNIEFKIELCKQISIVLNEIENVVRDLFENIKMEKIVPKAELQSAKENQIPPKE